MPSMADMADMADIIDVVTARSEVWGRVEGSGNGTMSAGHPVWLVGLRWVPGTT